MASHDSGTGLAFGLRMGRCVSATNSRTARAPNWLEQPAHRPAKLTVPTLKKRRRVNLLLFFKLLSAKNQIKTSMQNTKRPPERKGELVEIGCPKILSCVLDRLIRRLLNRFNSAIFSAAGSSSADSQVDSGPSPAQIRRVYEHSGACQTRRFQRALTTSCFREPIGPPSLQLGPSPSAFSHFALPTFGGSGDGRRARRLFCQTQY